MYHNRFHTPNAPPAPHYVPLGRLRKQLYRRKYSVSILKRNWQKKIFNEINYCVQIFFFLEHFHFDLDPLLARICRRFENKNLKQKSTKYETNFSHVTMFVRKNVIERNR